jgi:hypothetical protein
VELAPTRRQPVARRVPNARGRVTADLGGGGMWRRRRRRDWAHESWNTGWNLQPDGGGQHGFGLGNPEPQREPYADRRLVKPPGSTPTRGHRPAVQANAARFREVAGQSAVVEWTMGTSREGEADADHRASASLQADTNLSDGRQLCATS